MEYSQRISRTKPVPHHSYQPCHSLKTIHHQGRNPPTIQNTCEGIQRRRGTTISPFTPMGSRSRSQTNHTRQPQLQNLPAESEREGQLTRVPRRTARQRIHTSLKIPVCIPLLLH